MFLQKPLSFIANVLFQITFPLIPYITLTFQIPTVPTAQLNPPPWQSVEMQVGQL